MAANLAVATLGTDTGGSVRQPGSFCGVTGAEPQLRPRFTIRPDRLRLFAGPNRAVRADRPRYREVMSVIAGRDPSDSTSASVPVPDYGAGLGRPLHGLRIGIPDDYFGEGIDPEVRKKIEAGIALLERLGCRRVSIRMPNTQYAIAAYYIIATAEASSNLARYDGVRYGPRVPGATLIEMYQKTRGRGFGAEVKRRIVLGNLCPFGWVL